MKLKTKIIVALVPLFLTVFAVHSVLTYQTAVANAESNMKREAHNIRAVLMATRRVYHQQFLKSGLPVNDTTVGFLPAHALGRISKEFPKWTDSGLVFNNVSDRARNPDNAADKVQLTAMEFYRKNPDVKERFDLVEGEDGEDYFHYTQPIWIENYCLKCHGKREDAPASISARYDSSYGYELGDLRGVMSIKIPASLAHEQAWTTFMRNVMANLGCYIGASVLIYVLLMRTAVTRLKVLEHGAEELAGGNYEWRSGITGSDEISSVATGFDEMAGRIGLREAALRSSEAQFRDLVESAPDAMVISDRQGRITVVNNQAVKMFGYSREELLGQEVEMLISPPLRDSHRGQRQQYIESPVVRPMGVNLHLRGFRKDGSEFPIEVCLGPIDTADGLVIVSTIRDITARKALEQETREQRDALRHVSRISTMGEMATGIAHELNQPLAAIASYSFVADTIVRQSGSIPDELRETLGKLEDQAIRAGDIVRRLRNFSQKTESTQVSADLNMLVRDVAKFVEPDIRQAETKLSLKFGEPPPRVRIDEIQIQQVLVNLIRNGIDAMQETPVDQREVTVSTRILQDGKAEVIVSDTGKGLAEDELEQIFNAFFSTKQEGMGMGLAISRSIIEAHRGRLWAEANDGPGVTFGFTIPLENGHDE